MKVSQTIFDSLPATARPSAYEFYTRVHPNRDRIQTKRVGDCYSATNLETRETVYVHDSRFIGRVQRMGYESYRKRLRNKYQCDDFVSVESGDTVVDAGSFIGGFALSTIDDAERVVIVEPDIRLHNPLRLTFENKDDITIVGKALADESGTAEMQFGDDPSENSLINIDAGEMSHISVVELITLEELMSSQEMSSIDFFKLDAEGAEPEVIDGFGEACPRKVAIDTGPERYGQSTTGTIKKKLEMKGYDTKQTKSLVFGKQ